MCCFGERDNEVQQDKKIKTRSGVPIFYFYVSENTVHHGTLQAHEKVKGVTTLIFFSTAKNER